MKVSVVCPFYNEGAIIQGAVEHLLATLRQSDLDWELIVVNDGSTDDSQELVSKALAGEPRARVLGYPHNQGRGYALKTGIDAAKGDIIVTTEIDLSWGDDIVERIFRRFEQGPPVDVVVASPNLPGGGYRNVPAKRVWISKLGNQFIRLLFTRKITMNTGMTRGYRREVIQGLQTDEKGKEFHLEVLLKMVLLGHTIDQVPAVLEWKDHKFQQSDRPQRVSSSKLNKLILSHLGFAIFANPLRYFWFLGVLTLLSSAFFIIWAFIKLFTGGPVINLALFGLVLGIFSLLLFSFGVVSAQINRILREMWRPRN